MTNTLLNKQNKQTKKYCKKKYKQKQKHKPKLTKNKKYNNSLKGGANTKPKSKKLFIFKEYRDENEDKDKDEYEYNVLLDLPFIKYTKDNKEIRGYEDVAFIAVKLSISNIDYWETFCENQMYELKQLYRDGQYSDGLLGFEESLKHFKSDNPYDIWIIYSIESTAQDFKSYNNIEMCFSLFIDKISPITTHMGIFRNSKFFTQSKTKYKQHKNLSLYLHSFAAKISQLLFPESPKYYMVTSPVKLMRDILVIEMQKYLEELQKNNPSTKLEDIIVIGNNNQRNRIRNSIKHKTKNESNITKAKLKELEGLEYPESHSRLKEFVNEEFKNDDELNYSLLDEKKKKRFYDLNQLKNNNKIHSLDDYEKVFGKQYFIPRDIDYNPPLHFIDDTHWSITYNGETINFNKPKWFKHKFLLNISKTTIIDINHLANMYFKDYIFNV